MGEHTQYLLMAIAGLSVLVNSLLIPIVIGIGRYVIYRLDVQQKLLSDMQAKLAGYEATEKMLLKTIDRFENGE